MKNPFPLIIIVVAGAILGLLVYRAMSPEVETASSEAEFRALVSANQRPILVDFYADWCAPCQQLKPVLAEIENQYRDQIDVVRINVDNNPVLSQEYRVSGIPKLVLIRDGEAVGTLTGFQPKSTLVNWMESTLPELR